MSQTPFATPSAELSPAHDMPVSGSHQVYRFMAAQVAAMVCLFLINLGIQWFMAADVFHDRMERFLPAMLGGLVGGLLAYVAAVLLLVQHQRERHAIAYFRPQGGLLLGFGVSYVMGSLLLGFGIDYASQPLYEWASDQNQRWFWSALFGQAEALVNLLLACVAPLWLILRLARPRSDRLVPGAHQPVTGRLVALGVALCFGAMLYKLSTLLATSAQVVYTADKPWQPLYSLISCVVPIAIVMAAVWTRLPAQVSRFSAWRVLAAAVVLLALWGQLLVLCSTVLALQVDDSFDPRYWLSTLVLPAVLMLAALWPLSRLCVRWFFAGELAQSSPR